MLLGGWSVVGRYLAVDTQLFIFLPFLVLLGFWNRWAGLAVCLGLSVGTLHQLFR